MEIESFVTEMNIEIKEAKTVSLILSKQICLLETFVSL